MSSNQKSAVSQCPSPVARARVAITHLMFCTDFQKVWDTWDTGTPNQNDTILAVHGGVCAKCR